MSDSRDPVRVRQMFDGVARRYDLLNRLLSLGLDRLWRRAATLEALAGRAEMLLDLCAGTGDLTIHLARAAESATAICCDFSHRMLVRADRKLRKRRLHARCPLLEADALGLPFRRDTFDAVTVAFGVRNLAEMDAGLREILRVLRPGGRLVVLEFSRPTGPLLARAHAFYLNRVLPRVGDGISDSRGAYGYLARTIAEFPEPAILAGRMRDSGFAACGWKTLSGGIVAIHTALKASSPRSDSAEQD